MRDDTGGRIRFIGAHVDLPTALAAHLRALADGVGNGDDELTEALAALVAALQTTVSSYAGLRLTLVLDGWPVTLTAFPGIDGKSSQTSLRVTLSTLGDGFDPQSKIVLYAYTPGAFVDLAADLGYLHRRRRAAGDGHASGYALDGDLPPVSVVSGLSGWTEYVAVNRAVGVLIWSGQTADEALVTLRRDAGAAGLSVPGYAARLLGE